MDSQRWTEIQNLFHEAADLPTSEREAFLTSACGQDQELISEVMSMLNEDNAGSSVLDHKLADIAHETLESSRSFPLPQFGPYRTLKLLGEGGMGVVYLAKREDLGSRVAIKVLRDAWLSPARRDRFASEQRTLAQLHHPSIAQIYDADVLPDGTPWFAMEYVEGTPLTTYCRNFKCGLEERLQLFRSVCEAVQYAHSNAVIHRDLKPSNILVRNDTGIRLLDFGISKQLESVDMPIDQTMTGLRLMTPAYAAPEQIRGDRVGISSDVYSMGVILYELLTDGLPFDLTNLTPAEAASVIAGHEPGKPSAVVKRISPEVSGAKKLSKTAWADLDVLCLTAMHRDPERRYRSVEGLIRDVDHYLNGEPLEARADSIRYRMGKFVRRNQRAVSLGAAASAVIIGLVVFFTIRLAIARNNALAEADRTQRIQQFMVNLFQGGDEAAGPADTLRVVTLLDRGVQEANALNNDPKEQAELYENLGSIYQKLGKFDKADSLLRSAMDARKSLFGADSPEYAESLVAVANLRESQAHFDEAEKLTEQALEIDRRRLPPDHPELARAMVVMGKTLEGRGQYDQAIKVLEDAAEIQSAPGVAPQDLAATLSELANNNFYAGHLDVSDSLNRRVLSMQRNLYGDHHPLIADTLINLGAIQFQRGYYQESERFNREALEIVQGWYGTDHPETADTMTILGQSLTNENKLDEAASYLRQSEAILEHVYGPVHPRVAFALNELGRLLVRQHKLDDAEADFKREIEIYRTVYHDKHYLISIALSNLAGVYAERKEYPQAEKLFREALRRYADTLPADHINVGIAHVRLADTLVNQHRYADAEPESVAGYEILRKQSNPKLSWLQMARKQLGEEYGALNQPQKSAQFKTEFAANDKPDADPVKH